MLKHNLRSTRYKDIYDFYYLINEQPINKTLLLKYIDKTIINDSSIKYENMDSVCKAVNELLNDENFKNHVNDSLDKWIDKPINDIIESICDFIKSIK